MADPESTMPGVLGSARAGAGTSSRTAMLPGLAMKTAAPSISLSVGTFKGSACVTLACADPERGAARRWSRGKDSWRGGKFPSDAKISQPPARVPKLREEPFAKPTKAWPTLPASSNRMLSKLFDLEDYAGTYRETRNAYLKAANQLKLATGPYKAARDAYVAATATYTKSLYE